MCTVHARDMTPSSRSGGQGPDVPELHRSNNWKDCSCQATTPRALPREQTKAQTHSSCENSLFARSTDFEFPTYLETKEALSSNIRRHQPQKYPGLTMAR